MIKQIINDQKFTNIQKAQAGLTKLFDKAKTGGNFYTVLKNDEPLGVLVPQDIWRSLVEDIEALSSINFKGKIARSRADKTRIKADQARKSLGL